MQVAEIFALIRPLLPALTVNDLLLQSTVARWRWLPVPLCALIVIEKRPVHGRRLWHFNGTDTKCPCSFNFVRRSSTFPGGGRWIVTVWADELEPVKLPSPA